MPQQSVTPAWFLPALGTSSSLCLPEISGVDGNQEAVLSVSPLWDAVAQKATTISKPQEISILLFTFLFILP